MKKKILIGICIILVLLMLIPIPFHYKDGGSVEYRAVLYSVKDVHMLNSDVSSEQEYIDGLEIKILGIKVYSNIK